MQKLINRFPVLVTILLTLLLIINPLINPGTAFLSFAFILFMYLFWAVSTNKQVNNIFIFIPLIFFFIGLILQIVFKFDSEQSKFVYSILSIICLVLTEYILILALIRSQIISENQIFGLINCYMLMGFLWGFIYLILNQSVPDAFIINNQVKSIHNNLMYFSFVTLTTVGYGDIVPNNDLVQRVAILEAVQGQLFLSLVVTYIITRFMNVSLEKK